jgi:hypothetical protein
MGTTTNLALPYPEPTDSVDYPRDNKALAQAVDAAIVAERPAAAASAVRPGDQTVAVGVAGDLSGIVSNYPLKAGVRYKVTGTGVISVGGATAEVACRINVLQAVGGGLSSWSLVQTCPVGQKMNVANQFTFIAASTTTATISFQATTSAPSTGLILYIGSSVIVEPLS